MPAPTRPEDYTRRQRTRIVTLVSVRTVSTATALLVAYFVLPLSRPAGAGITVLVVGSLLLTAVLAWQLRAIITSPYPRLRAFETLTVGVTILLVMFAAAYFLLSQGDPGSFSQPVDRVGALYLTITVFATVGFGDITPVQDVPRILVSIQMLLDLVVFGLVAKLIVGAVDRNLRRRAAAPAVGTDPSAP
jgi:voltage-gated potassium channel